MATVSSSNFSTNSLTGTTVVRNGFANISLLLTPYVLEGDKEFTVKLRRDSTTGTVIVSVPTQTIRDNSSFVSLTANTASINEGDLVSYTLVMANTVNNANLYYSIIPFSANLNQSDFFANTGVVTIINNQAVFTIRANVDAGYADETGEAFRIQLRQGSPTGNIFFTTTANVAIVDTYKLTNYISLIESADAAAESDTITFTFTAHNVAPGTIFYYDTVGNVTSSTFSTGNTGSFVMNGTSNVISLAGATGVPANETRFYQLNIRSGNANGFVAMTSNVITLVDDAAAFVTASGGLEYINDGYKTHVYTTSNNLVISGLGILSNRNLYYEVVAGGGAGGYQPGGSTAAGVGGAGGFLRGNTTLSTTGTFAMVVGGGAISDAIRGSNSSILANTFIATGGGMGGKYGAPAPAAQPGGSGGGGAAFNPAGSGIPGQGFSGGPGVTLGGQEAYGGGGGGAGETGGRPQNYVHGKGGDGLPSVSINNIPAQAQPLYGTPGGPSPGRWFAGGATQQGPAGQGKGGGGYYLFGSPSLLAGVTNTGGGGSVSPTGANGGSGIVIVRYPYTLATYELIDDVGFTRTVTDNTRITYSVTTINVANTSTLYWTMSGNISNADVLGGNTGSVTVLNSNATFSFSLANNIVSGNDTKEFTLQLRKNSVTGGVAATANTITVYAGSDRSNFVSATGGTIIDTGKYRLHVFTSSDNLVVSNAGRMGGYVDYLTVAGGGGGSGGYANFGNPGAAGGAGGLLTGTTAVSAQSYSANVGSGGTGGTGYNVAGTNGGNTNIFGFLSVGGGGGAYDQATNRHGAPGGSGAGAAGYVSTSGDNKLGGNAYIGQGNPGGTIFGTNPGGQSSSGGGGAGGAGQSFAGYSNGPRDGGIGRSISWVPASYGTPGPTSGRWFAGGGGGSTGENTGQPGEGGAGGGGRGAMAGPQDLQAFSGNAFTGGGGGGGQSASYRAGAGGSGIIIIRYPYV